MDLEAFAARSASEWAFPASAWFPSISHACRRASAAGSACGPSSAVSKPVDDHACERRLRARALGPRQRQHVRTKHGDKVVVGDCCSDMYFELEAAKTDTEKLLKMLKIEKLEKPKKAPAKK